MVEGGLITLEKVRVILSRRKEVIAARFPE
jgi:hypothetical protein